MGFFPAKFSSQIMKTMFGVCDNNYAINTEYMAKFQGQMKAPTSISETFCTVRL